MNKFLFLSLKNVNAYFTPPSTYNVFHIWKLRLKSRKNISLKNSNKKTLTEISSKYSNFEQTKKRGREWIKKKHVLKKEKLCGNSLVLTHNRSTEWKCKCTDKDSKWLYGGSDVIVPKSFANLDCCSFTLPYFHSTYANFFLEWKFATCALRFTLNSTTLSAW